MPTNSIRKKVLLRLKKLITQQEAEIIIDQFIGANDIDSSNSSSNDSDDVADYKLNLLIERQKVFDEIMKRRYLFRRLKYRVGYNKEVFKRHFSTNTENGTSPWLSDKEFKECYRMNRRCFWKLVDLIKDHDVFKRKGRFGRFQSH